MYDESGGAKGDQSLRKRPNPTKPIEAINVGGFVQAASFSKSMDGTQFRIGSNNDEFVKITNSILTGFNLGQSIPDAKVQLSQTNYTYEVYYSGHALIKYTVSSFNKSVSNDTVVPYSEIVKTMKAINDKNRKNANK